MQQGYSIKKLTENFYIPTDVEEMTKEFGFDNGNTDRGGICGQSCLAVIEKTTIRNVLGDWKSLGLEWKGYSGWKQLREYLEKKNYLVKQVRAKDLKFDSESFYLLRIQWIGEGENKEKPYYGYNHWSVASAFTHFIIVHGNKFYCNEYGLYDIESLDDYLSYYNAVITSAMKIRITEGSSK